MVDIKKYTDKIRSAPYARDVRDAIADALDMLAANVGNPVQVQALEHMDDKKETNT